MEVETSTPPITINTSAPDGAPPRRFKTENFSFAVLHGSGGNRIGPCALKQIIFHATLPARLTNCPCLTSIGFPWRKT